MNLIISQGPVVLAAEISSVVGLISVVVAWIINHGRMEVDREIAIFKAKAEEALAERRVILERELAIAKRRAEVAEQVLSLFYRVKRAFDVARRPLISVTEMIPEHGVAADVVTNEGYAVIRRLREFDGLFADLEASRFTFGALFGHDTTAPYDHVIRLQNEVVDGAQALRNRFAPDWGPVQEHMTTMRRKAFSSTSISDDGVEIPNAVSMAIADAVTAIERTCRPVLESPLAAEAAGRPAEPARRVW